MTAKTKTKKAANKGRAAKQENGQPHLPKGTRIINPLLPMYGADFLKVFTLLYCGAGYFDAERTNARKVRVAKKDWQPVLLDLFRELHMNSSPEKARQIIFGARLIAEADAEKIADAFAEELRPRPVRDALMELVKNHAPELRMPEALNPYWMCGDSALLGKWRDFCTSRKLVFER